jgi:iron complex outermembrane receptor protein
MRRGGSPIITLALDIRILTILYSTKLKHSKGGSVMKVILGASVSVLAMTSFFVVQPAYAQSSAGEAAVASNGVRAAVAGQPAATQAAGEPAGAPKQPEAEEGRQNLTEIVVTARRREESLQSVPVSITALSGAEITQKNIVSTQDLQAHVPGLQTRAAAYSRQQVSFRIRGLGQAIGGSLPSVVTYFQDVPTNAAGPGLLYDLESVQVLKGPQGTLFGRNTVGGAVLINPKQPTSELGGYLDVSAGSLDYRRVQGAINVPLSDAIKLRVAFDSNEREGFTTDIGTGQKLDGRNYFDLRVGLLLTPFEGLTNYTVYDQYRNNSTGGSLILQAVRPGSLTDILNPGILDALALQKAMGNRFTNTSIGQSYDISIAHSLTNVLTYELDDHFTFKNILGYRGFKQRYTGDSDGSPFQVIEVTPSPDYTTGGSSGDPSQHVYTAEIQLQGSKLFNFLDFIVGGYYEDAKPNSNTDSNEFFLVVRQVNRQVLRYDTSKAVFGQATANFGGMARGLSLTGGMRYTEDDRAIKASETSAGECRTILPNNGCFRDLAASFSQVTYNVSLDYKVNDDLLLYAAHRKGYKSGGFNQGVAVLEQAALSYKPEIVQDYEVGAKADFHIGDRPVRVNGALYQNNLSQIQRTVQLVFADSTAVVTGNDGNAVIRGAELEVSAIPIDNLRISGLYAYTDPKYKIPELVNTAFTIVPKHKFGLSLDYTVDLNGDAGSITPSLVFSYQSSSHTSNNTDANDIQPGYGLLDARIDWEVPKLNAKIYAFVSNITDKEYVTSNVNILSSLGFMAVAFGDPRTFGVGIRYTY